MFKSQQKPTQFATIFFYFSALSTVSKETKFQVIVVSNFGIFIALGSRKSKEINLYSDYTENIVQTFIFAAITSICISLQHWDLA